VIVAVRGWADEETLQAIAEHKEERGENEGGEIGIEPEQRVCEERSEHRRREQRTMREIDDVENAVDEREPERHERVDGASQEPIENGSKNNVRRQHYVINRAAAYAGGMGKTGFAEAKVCGNMTWISLLSTCVFTGAAPWFWPLTNLVDP